MQGSPGEVEGEAGPWHSYAHCKAQTPPPHPPSAPGAQLLAQGHKNLPQPGKIAPAIPPRGVTSHYSCNHHCCRAKKSARHPIHQMQVLLQPFTWLRNKTLATPPSVPVLAISSATVGKADIKLSNNKIQQGSGCEVAGNKRTHLRIIKHICASRTCLIHKSLKLQMLPCAVITALCYYKWLFSSSLPLIHALSSSTWEHNDALKWGFSPTCFCPVMKTENIT